MDQSPPAIESPTTVVMTRSGVATTAASFVLIGASASLLGPLLITFGQRFHLTPAVAGRILSVFFAGALLGVVPGWLGGRRLAGGRVLSVALLVIALGGAGASIASRWNLLLASVFILGLGFGAVTITVNTLLARTPEVGRAFRLSVANAAYGVGAIITPLVLAAIKPRHYPGVFATIAALSGLLAVTTGGVHAPPHHGETRERPIADATRRRRILATFIVAYVFYEALESSSSGWMASQLHGAGYSDHVAIVVTAGFWIGMTVTRALGGVLHRRFSAAAIVLASLALAIVAGLAISSSTVAPIGYPVLGMILASVFPMGLMWFSLVAPHDSDGMSLLILFNMAGGILGPGAVDLLVAHQGVRVVPFAIAALACIDLVIFASLRRFRRASSDPLTSQA
ncbi:MAG TPA: MFS transporter [Acidimicrobiales bacterium]|nr:MFS transporter [Acidimicrobiales bacterium]